MKRSQKRFVPRQIDDEKWRGLTFLLRPIYKKMNHLATVVKIKELSECQIIGQLKNYISTLRSRGLYEFEESLWKEKVGLYNVVVTQILVAASQESLEEVSTKAEKAGLRKLEKCPMSIQFQEFFFKIICHSPPSLLTYSRRVSKKRLNPSASED